MLRLGHRILLAALVFLPLSHAWAPTSTKSYSRKRCHSFSGIRQMVSTPPEVDEVYYSPISTESQEMEKTAAGMKYGMGGGSASQQITLTRWLSAKVQDFPEVRRSDVSLRICVA